MIKLMYDPTVYASDMFSDDRRETHDLEDIAVKGNTGIIVASRSNWFLVMFSQTGVLGWVSTSVLSLIWNVKR